MTAGGGVPSPPGEEASSPEPQEVPEPQEALVPATADSRPATPPDPVPYGRGHRSPATGVAVSLASAALGLLAGAGLIAMAGGSPVQGYAAMVEAAFGGQLQLARLLIGMAPLLLMGLGYAIAYRAKFITIGAQGQFDCGAMAAGALVLTVPLNSAWVAIPLGILLAALAGGLVGALAGVLRATWGVNEIISSLMLNYLAFYALGYVVRQPLSDPEGFTPESAVIPVWAQLPLPATSTGCAGSARLAP